jgi:hypothetical protein
VSHLKKNTSNLTTPEKLHCCRFFILQNFIPTFLATIGGPGQGLAITGGLSCIPWVAAALVGPLAGEGRRVWRGAGATGPTHVLPSTTTPGVICSAAQTHVWDSTRPHAQGELPTGSSANAAGAPWLCGA